MKVIVNVFLKEGVLDPQGKAAHHALDSLGFEGVKDVRIGKQIVMNIDAADKAEAEDAMKRMRLKQDDMYKKDIITPAAADKLLKKARPRLWTKLSEHIVIPEGKLTLTTEDDKREAVVVQGFTNLDDDLGDLA